MKVGIFCTNNYTYPLPEGVIYANQVVAGTLADRLAREGVEVVLFAPEGSRTEAELVTFGMAPYSDPDVQAQYPEGSYFYEHLMVARSFRYAEEENVDVIHAHLRPFSVIPMAAVSRKQTLLTVHDPLYFPAYEALPLAADFRNISYVALSEAHQRTRVNLNWQAVVYNGIDLESWGYQPAAGDYLCFVGRLMPEKGVDVAVEVALKAGIPLKIAGSLYDSDKDFFEEKISPCLGNGVEYLGSLSPDDVMQLYQGARGLLMPIKWEEPFGLVMIEAMACGTPVVAFDRGSVSEVVKDGSTGYIVDSSEEMVKAVNRLPDINRSECREWVKKRFSIDRMAKDYLELYRDLVKEQDG